MSNTPPYPKDMPHEGETSNPPARQYEGNNPAAETRLTDNRARFSAELRDLSDQSSDQGRPDFSRICKAWHSHVQANPIQCVLAALGVGLIIGVLSADSD